MLQYCDGDSMAFEALYERHSGRLLGFFQKKQIPSPSDLLQETFLKLHGSRNQYNPQYPFLPWLFTIARNALLDSLRKSALENKRFAKIENLENIAVQEKIESFTPKLSSATSTLPARQKIAIELRYLEEWSFEDIAKKLNTSPDNVRQLTSRGIKALKNLLKKGEQQ